METTLFNAPEATGQTEAVAPPTLASGEAKEMQHPTAGEIQRAIKPLPESKGRGLAMQSLDDMWRFAQYMAQSPFAPKGMDTKAIVVAIQMGAEIGLAPTVAVRSIAVINGRPSLWGDALLGLCQAHHSWDPAAFEETVTETKDGLVARCTVRRRGGKVTTREFTMVDAKRAGLASKAGTWQQYPKRMLQMRARSLALRDTFSDVLQGICSREEAMDIIDVEPTGDRKPPEREPGTSKTAALTKQLMAPKPDAKAAQPSREENQTMSMQDQAPAKPASFESTCITADQARQIEEYAESLDVNAEQFNAWMMEKWSSQKVSELPAHAFGAVIEMLENKELIRQGRD